MAAAKREETRVKGLTGSEGIAIGPVLVIDEKKKKIQPRKIKTSDIYAHLQRFTKAKQIFIEELDELARNLDHKTAEILDTQKHIISDQEIERQVNQLVEVKQVSVDYAIYVVFNRFIERLRESGSELFRQRIIDLENLRDRLISLSCKDDIEKEVEKGAILILRDISPTDLVAYHEKGVTGLVIDKGGVTSHAAIIAQSLNLPCIVSAKTGVKSASLAKKAVLDASSGELILDPTRESLNEFKKKIRELNRAKKELLKVKDTSETKDGFPFHLRANVEFEQEVTLVNQYKAEGVGLLRTEALLFGGMHRKSEEEQNIFYDSILLKTSGPVVIRLFDVGGDKLNAHTPDEKNPFLGWRGIRMLLDEKEMFYGQIRAILKVAGKYPGRVKILVPMVSQVEEIREVRKAVEEIQKFLMDQNVPIDESIPIGIMIEVPSVALMANQFSKEVDFFSIGTNDLTQYALAVDRGNERICDLYNHSHPAVWSLIKLAADSARLNGIEISVCGELAGDPIGAVGLLGMGINDLSMSASSIPKIKEVLSTRSQKEMEKFSEAILGCATHTEVQELYHGWDWNL